MTENNKHIDKLFQYNLKDFRIESTQENLSLFNKTINKYNFFRFSFNSFNIYFSILSVGIIITGSLLLFNPFSNTEVNDNTEIIDHDIEIEEIIQKEINVEDQESLIEETKLQTETQSDFNEKSSNVIPIDILEEEETTEENNETEIDKTIEIPKDENPLDTAVVIVHDTVVVKKTIIVIFFCFLF
jgi:hypothetical protein